MHLNFCLLGDDVDTFSRLKRRLGDRFPNLPAVERSRFVMMAPYAQMVFSNQKSTTIRFTPEAVEFPARATLPLFVVAAGESHRDAKHRGELQILSVQYKKVQDLDEDDAQNDGFRSKDELIEALQTLYVGVTLSDWVCIYSVRLAEDANNGVKTGLQFAPYRNNAGSFVGAN